MPQGSFVHCRNLNQNLRNKTEHTRGPAPAQELAGEDVPVTRDSP